MSQTIATVFKPGVTAEMLDEATRRPRKRLTRSLTSTKAVQDYKTFTLCEIQGCQFFQRILETSNNIDKEVGKHVVDNYILNISLPIVVVGTMEKFSRRMRRERRWLSFAAPIGEVQDIVAGSSSEGLALPQITHIKGKQYITDTPDEDRKFIFSNLIVRHTGSFPSVFALSESAPECPPGFINLRYNIDFGKDKIDTIDAKKVWKPSDFTETGFVDRVKFVKLIRFVLKDHIRNYKRELKSFSCKGHDPKVTFSEHGPAITVDLVDETTNQAISKDYVICLPYPKWPEVANSWITRTRVWPCKPIIRKVVRDGCHIVPKPFHKGKTGAAEFLYSFSVCDTTLAQSLSLPQKQCYMLFKYIYKYRLNRVKRGLSSFYAKQTFFWFCEKLPVEVWREDNVLYCLVSLLNELKTRLNQRFMPHYYIPEFNLISELKPASLEACVRDIEEVVASPSLVVLQLSENHRLQWLSRDVSLVQLLEPILTRINVAVSAKLLKQTTLSFLSKMLDKGETEMIMPILCRKWASGIGSYTNTAIKVLETLIENNDGISDMLCFKGFLANLYLQRYAEESERSGESNSAILTSVALFHEIIDDIREHIWIYAAYYDSCFQITAYKELIRHFLAKVYPGTSEHSGYLYEPGIYTAINEHNNLTTYTDVIALMFKSVQVPSTAYILFKVILAYMELSRKAKTVQKQHAFRSEARKVLKHFEKWLQRKASAYPEIDDACVFYMLVVSANEAGDIDVLQSALKEAIKYGSTFSGFEITYGPQFDDIDIKDIDFETEQTISTLTNTSGVKQDRTSFAIPRFHPYSTRNRACARSPEELIPPDLKFIQSEPRVGPYLHG